MNIGAAKADFFCYAILYKRGGIYLDIDSRILKPLDQLILPDDTAIIARESHFENYIQWALIFESNHIIMEKTLDVISYNIRNNCYPHDVHQMTGPSVYTKAINELKPLLNNSNHREVGIDYDEYFQFSYPLSKFFLYKNKIHWKQDQLKRTVLK